MVNEDHGGIFFFAIPDGRTQRSLQLIEIADEPPHVAGRVLVAAEILRQRVHDQEHAMVWQARSGYRLPKLLELFWIVDCGRHRLEADRRRSFPVAVRAILAWRDVQIAERCGNAVLQRLSSLASDEEELRRQPFVRTVPVEWIGTHR